MGPAEGRTSNIETVSSFERPVSQGFAGIAELAMRPGQVARSYLRSWFSLDSAVVTCDWLSGVIRVLQLQFEAGDAFETLRFTQLVRPARAGSVIRMMRAVRVLEVFMEVHLPPAGRLMFQLRTFPFVIMWRAHMMACTGYRLFIADPTDTGFRWMDFVALNPDTPFVETALLYQCAASFQCAVSRISLSSVDALLTNNLERFSTVLMMMAGFLFGSSVVSWLSAAMVDYLMMREDAMQKQAQERLRGRSRIAEQEAHVLEVLSSAPRKGLRFAIKNLLGSICFSAIGFHALHAHDDLFSAGSHRGSLEYAQDLSSSAVTADEKTTVTENRWICEGAMGCKWMHVGKAEAAMASEIRELHAEEFPKDLEKVSTIRRVAYAYQQLRSPRWFPPRSRG